MKKPKSGKSWAFGPYRMDPTAGLGPGDGNAAVTARGSAAAAEGEGEEGKKDRSSWLGVLSLVCGVCTCWGECRRR